MFEWNWDSIAAECTNFIGPAGIIMCHLAGGMALTYHFDICNAGYGYIQGIFLSIEQSTNALLV